VLSLGSGEVKAGNDSYCYNIFALKSAVPAIRGKDYGKSKMKYHDYVETESVVQYKVCFHLSSISQPEQWLLIPGPITVVSIISMECFCVGPCPHFERISMHYFDTVYINF
jgi:hypothetical protein